MKKIQKSDAVFHFFGTNGWKKEMVFKKEGDKQINQKLIYWKSSFMQRTIGRPSTNLLK